MTFAVGTRVTYTEGDTVRAGTIQERYKFPSGVIYGYRVLLDGGLLVHAFESDVIQLA